ncbi:hypothetical protein [Acetobacter orientalis]|uniref:Pathogenicity locus n=1 Tax=Acetobacter orientalis TaxID=146474 RepID=A0A2Z5ZG75_9PROT|nr:hypothetical protein [Acetobacter orientalis]BBC79365.1 Pathogenicity locus [Acetobacter orientalis]
MPHFSAPERTALLAIKGVGPCALERLEECGIPNLLHPAQAGSQLCTQMTTLRA